MRRLLEWLETRSYRAARLVVVPNSSYRDVAMDRGRVPAERAIVVRSGADEARPRSKRTRGGPLVVAFAGVMGPQDRVDVLLYAAALVLARRPGGLRLDLIGRGDDVERLRGLVRELGLESSVSWAGWLSGAEVADRLMDADVAVSLDGDDEFSRKSTMTKVPEYLALGLPCVISDLPENRVTAGDAAWYFTPGDPEALAHQLLAILDAPSAADELARRAEARAPWLLWERGGTRLVAAYRWMFGEGPPVPGSQPLPPDSPIAAK